MARNWLVTFVAATLGMVAATEVSTFTGLMVFVGVLFVGYSNEDKSSCGR